MTTENPFPSLLRAEADRYLALARDHAIKSLHKNADGRTITELDARLIRDHELRAECFKEAAVLVERKEAT